MTRVALPYPTAERLLARSVGGRPAPVERFDRAYVIEATGCWRWSRGTTTSGYGHFSVDHIYYQAHRIAYILRFGHDIPAGLFIDHLCRNRSCVNPDHLEPVTHQENVRRGVRCFLTPDDVLAIRADVRAGSSQRAVALRRGIDHSTVSRIMRGERWGDVAERKAAA